jgi:hypothetical protein
MTNGEKMLRKLQGYLTDEELAKKLSDAYSTHRYRNGWINCIRMLRKREYTEDQIETIIRSKLTRWAGDASDNRYGFYSANDLARYIDKYPDVVKELLK